MALPQSKELSQESPPPSGDVSIQSNALIAIWVLFGITSVVMILRIFSQLKVVRRPGLDDGLMILAWVSASWQWSKQADLLIGNDYRSVKLSIPH
jgi:hypothetical protein